MTATTFDVLNRSYAAEDGAVSSGVSNDNRSTILPHTLTINKDNSNTTVSESASNAAVGSEGSVLRTANVASNFDALVPQGESVTNHVGSSSCSATTNGSGLAARWMSKRSVALDSYSVNATDVGESNFTITTAAGTTSSTYTLVVTA